jgi:histidine ammonia-lyase
MLEKKIVAREIMYGTNTGIGEFSEVVLTDEQVQQFQRYLIYNHAAGIGDPMLHRMGTRRHGRADQRPCPWQFGLRPEITLTLIEMLNKGVTPVVCQKGSVGACGDLAPMSQIALLLMGEGRPFTRASCCRAKVAAMERAGIPSRGCRRATAWPPSTAPTC